ncbi:clusterin [Pristis pectinata]|uniref:clusterin n=1 Tax=Pristis pectinata TaxID=685728 RepID=UPI00223DE03C|nr:clusterin [Pristis pectinata]XP_051880591.1 clusterin [Pristis pectinata]
MLTLWLVVLLAVSESFQELPPEKLKKLSTEGQKYLNKQLENAIDGAKVMKSLADKNDQEHRMFLRNLEQTNKQKKEALLAAKDAQKKLNEAEQCQSKESLWEECKPCLKQTCTQFYSRVCRRGFGTVEKEVEKFFNETPAVSVWVNGEKMDSLIEKNEELGEQFEHVERQYEDMDELFKESTRAFEAMDRLTDSPFGSFGFFPKRFSLFPDYSFPHFRPSIFDGHGMLSSFFDMTQRMFERFHKIMHDPELNKELFSEGEEQNVTKSPDGKDRFICHEIRRNSSGCMKLSNKCEKCKELMSLECFDADHKPLRKAFEESLAMAENFAKKYDNLMEDFQQYMENKTKELETLNKQFGWVSKLANYTKSPDGFFRVKAILSRSESNNSTTSDPDINVTVQIFDSPPLTFTVPGKFDWDDPELSEMLAQKALDLYNERKISEDLPTRQLETIEA